MNCYKYLKWNVIPQNIAINELMNWLKLDFLKSLAVTIYAIEFSKIFSIGIPDLIADN